MIPARTFAHKAKCFEHTPEFIRREEKIFFGTH